MAKAVQKIILSASRDIPFNKLVLSQSNVRRLKAGVSVEDLAEDIARRGLLQSLNVRRVVDAEGAETDQFEIPAGGRRYRALERLVRQKRLSKTALIPCIVRDPGVEISAEEDSLAENVQRVALHPLDQFRAFKTLREQGAGEEEIAARFFVAPGVVKQRLRLAAVSEKLLEVYAEDGMSLEQLMAFTVTTDHARQEQVWEALQQSYDKEPYLIRRQLTESAVRGSDRRARFVGADAYEAAGGTILRDLFEDDSGGWFEDVALLDRLATETLAAAAEKVAAEGWKWIEVAVDFRYGHMSHLRQLDGVTLELTPAERATFDALTAEYAKLEGEYEGADELPDEVDARLGDIETALAAFENRPRRYEPTEIARAGVFVSIDADGHLDVDRGYVRAEDEPSMPVGGEGLAEGEARNADGTAPAASDVQRTVITIGGGEPDDDDDGDNVVKPLPERLVSELTAHRTLALRDAVANNPQVALTALDLRHGADLPEDRRPCRLCSGRPPCLGRPRHQDLDLRSRCRDRAAGQAAHGGGGLCRPSSALIGRESDVSLQRRRISERDQLDLFRALPGDLAPRDAQDLMAYPFFSLAKSKRVLPIDYRTGAVAIRVEAVPDHGMATIWDADVLIWAASQIVEARDTGLKTSRLMAATPYEILTFVGRGTGARDYDRLKAALDRLQSTTVLTSIRQPAERRRHRFSWINEWKETADANGRPHGLELILPDWFYAGVLDDALVLTIDRAYFDLTGGLERWLYRVVRKHGGRQAGGWSFDFLHLHAKSGSLSPLKHFAYDVREIVRRQTLPGYRLVIERGPRGAERLAFTAVLRDPATLRQTARPGDKL